MAENISFTPSALVIAVLSTDESKRTELTCTLEKLFGSISIISDKLSFPYTDYYDKEMGGHPTRYFILFNNTINPENLADIKIQTNTLEKRFSDSNGRKINLDPGILSLHNFILASCKNRGHRIPLKNGVYGELTLIYYKKEFTDLPWTYADYRSKEVKEILESFRAMISHSNLSIKQIPQN